MSPELANDPTHYAKSVISEWREFVPSIEGFDPADRREIKSNLRLAIEAHRGQPRITNDEFQIAHVFKTTRILTDECRIKDPIIVSTALLHDRVEDSKNYGDPETISFTEWQENSRVGLEKNGVDTRVIDLVLLLTKPHVNGIDVIDKADARNQYYDRLRSAPEEVLLIKMADRLHNLRTQYETSPEQKSRKIAETKNVYLELFERARKKYPIETHILLEQINLELVRLEAVNQPISIFPRADIVFQDTQLVG